MKRTKKRTSQLHGFSSGASLGGKVSRYRGEQNIYKQGAPAYTYKLRWRIGSASVVAKSSPTASSLYMLAPHIRVEEDLIDQLFNSSEKRLARALLMLARYGKQDQPQTMLAKVSQEMLAEMIGTTRSRVNFFMNKFRKLGFIHYNNGGLQVDNSLLSVVLHDYITNHSR